jgi:hypothetical protein
VIVRRILLLGLLAVALPACRGHAAGCDAAQAEPIDPLSSQHLLPGAAEPKYLTDPPTSGAHRPSALPPKVLTSPLDRPVQVSALEGGQVLIQYEKVPPETRRALVALAHRYDHVTVAPGRALPSKIVAPAWLFMQRCNGTDTKALRDFIVVHAEQHKND